MNFPVLVIGLGSMGKRRVRNLQALGFMNIFGFDKREDRTKEANSVYKITAFTDFEEAVKKSSAKAFIISLPPDIHHIYMKKAIELNIPFFIEASVVDTDMEKIIADAKQKKVFAAPSSTMYFHPAIQKIFEIVKSNYLGNLSNIMYHMGNYLPDWHTYEKVNEFYVSKKETGGAREIVPFELTWMTKLFGFPKQIVSTVKKTIEIEGASLIDDTYNSILDYGTFTMMLTVDVVTRHATRRLLINGSLRQLEWDWNTNEVQVFHHDRQEWEVFTYEAIAAAGGYNKNITEQMYIDEMHAFFRGIENPATYINTLEEDHKVLKLLYLMEKSYAEKKFVEVKL
ncbi:MAG TPA: Gfo/Idh/MocA family oxidoreductase [Bacteroidia bacterium]|jgi:predicted dehydrogenase|nr:Gfo/Idh/MocA family oxidoreductase [Bacteroidia bacterium]